MKTLQLLCATMQQKNFDKVAEMRIQSDVIFANQADGFSYDEYTFDSHLARMITTSTRGVGRNRNLSLLFADADICLLTDDDVVYRDGYEANVLSAFEALPDADVIIFGLKSIHSSDRKPPQIKRIRKLGRFSRNPYGGPRIAFRLEAIRKANIWFSLLFGGGCRYASGEDSIFIKDCRRKGLTIYTHPFILARTDTTTSSWFQGYNELFFFSKGAFFASSHPKTNWLWMLYTWLRNRHRSKISFTMAMQWMQKGAKGFQLGLSYDEWNAGMYERQ